MPRLTTKVLNSAGESVMYHIVQSNKGLVKGCYQVGIYAEGEKIGYMHYSIEEDHLFIKRMCNNSKDSKNPYKHVGTALFEYLFNKSVKYGKGGRIEVNSIDLSPPAYYKMGLRQKSMGGIFLEKLLSQYSITPSEEIKQSIINNECYSFLRRDAAINLNKPEKEVTFEETIVHGSYNPRNAELGKKLAMDTLLKERDFMGMTGIMYLPPFIIEEKKKEFSWFAPYGTGKYAFYRDSFNWMEDKRYENLKKLVDEGKLDSLNADEIVHKMSHDDPRIPVLTSEYGLKMLKRNYISAWYTAMYIHKVEDVKAIFSEHGLKAFEKGLIKNPDQLSELASNAYLPVILSGAGVNALGKGDIKITNGVWVYDKENNRLTKDDLATLLGMKTVTCNLYSFNI